MKELRKVVDCYVIDHDTTYEAIASACGLGTSTFSNKIHGRTKFWLAESRELARVLGMSLDDFAELVLKEE